MTRPLTGWLKSWLAAWSDDLPRTWSDYRQYLFYSVAPALVSVLMVGLVTKERLQPLGSVFQVETYGSGAETYIASVGLCGTLMLRAVLIQRQEDRSKPHPYVFMLLLSATLGAGFSLTGLADGDPRFPQLAICLFLLAAVPAGLHVSRWATKSELRKPVVDLRSTDQEFADDVIDAIQRRPSARSTIVSRLTDGTAN